MNRDELHVSMKVRYRKNPADVYTVEQIRPVGKPPGQQYDVRISNVHGHELTVSPADLYPYTDILRPIRRNVDWRPHLGGGGAEANLGPARLSVIIHFSDGQPVWQASVTGYADSCPGEPSFHSSEEVARLWCEETALEWLARTLAAATGE